MNPTDDIITQLNGIRTATLLKSKDIYNTTEACLFLGVKRSYLYELVHSRRIPHCKSRGGKLIYFRRQDLEAWMTHTPVPIQADTPPPHTPDITPTDK